MVLSPVSGKEILIFVSPMLSRGVMSVQRSNLSRVKRGAPGVLKQSTVLRSCLPVSVSAVHQCQKKRLVVRSCHVLRESSQPASFASASASIASQRRACRRPSCRRRVACMSSSSAADSSLSPDVAKAKQVLADINAVRENLDEFELDDNELSLMLEMFDSTPKQGMVIGYRDAFNLVRGLGEGADGAAYVAAEGLTSTLTLLLNELTGLRDEQIAIRDPDGEANRVTSDVLDQLPGLSDDDKARLAPAMASIGVFGVAGAAWNGIVLCLIFITLLLFVLPRL
ncbi:hypothetical protein NFJ02_19g34510 [Pycnococcus provasolii]